MPRPLRAVAVLVGAVLAVPLAPATPAAAATCPAPGGVAVTEAPPAAGDLVFRGHGWGHQLGMSQYGAQGAASLGCSSTQILAAYYPGTSGRLVAQRSAVLVDMLTDGGSAAVTAENGDVTWLLTQTGATARQPRGTTWRVVRDGSGARVTDGTRYVLTAASGQQLRVQHAGLVVRVRTYTASGAAHLDRRLRWDYTRIVPDSRGIDVRQVIQDDAAGRDGVTKYLNGIAEVPVSWHVEALEVQAIAARTFLERKWDAAAGAYVVLPTPAHQHYTGADQEDVDARNGGRWARAVAQTRDGNSGVLQVDSAGRPIETLYSSSFGGRGEDVRYVFRSTGYSYLRAIDDSRWDAASGNPNRSWSRGFTAATAARVFGFDTLESVTIGRWGGAERLEGVKVTGLDGGVRVTRTFRGWDVKAWFGLPSPGFTVTLAGPAGVAITGDWDGNGTSDPGWYDDGAVALKVGSGVTRYRFGTRGDVPVVGDWDADGKDELGVVRGSTWYLRDDLAGGAADRSFGYGDAGRGDRPLVGDWDGDGRDSVGIVRDGEWHLRHDIGGGTGQVVFTYGRVASGDEPVTGDWDDDGVETPGIVRAGTFYLRNALAGGGADVYVRIGRSTDAPVVGDWDADGRTTVGVVRGATWYLDDALDGGGADRTVVFAG